jgi:ABC-type antimicrobial peptide transport system permease subunit
VLRLAFGGALRVAVIGAVAGLGISLVITRLVSTRLFELSPNDPVSLIGAAVVLIVVTALATYIPARRAARIDSARALRAE